MISQNCFSSASLLVLMHKMGDYREPIIIIYNIIIKLLQGQKEIKEKALSLEPYIQSGINDKQ